MGSLVVLMLMMVLEIICQPAALNLILFENATENKAVCNDGTPSGFYFKEGNPNKWIIHFQGGGWCFDENSCLYRMKNDPFLMSSNTWPKQYSPDGLFDQNATLNPDWFDATYAYLPYPFHSKFYICLIYYILYFRFIFWYKSSIRVDIWMEFFWKVCSKRCY